MTFTILNLSDTSLESAGIQAYLDNGDPVDFPTHTVRRLAPLEPGAQGSGSVFCVNVIAPPPFPYIVGWARFEFVPSSNVQLQAELRFSDNRREGEQKAYLQPAEPGLRFRTTFRNPAPQQFNQETAFALVNPSDSQTATVMLRALRGRFECQTAVELRPLNRVSRFVSEFFEPCRLNGPRSSIVPDIVGRLDIESDTPIAVGALAVVNGPKLTFAPVPVYPLE